MGEDAKRNQLMGALAEHAHIKAALIVDAAGTVKARVGKARSLTSAAGRTDQFAPAGSGQLETKENVYLVGVGQEFLIAIFDDGTDFDGIKRDVDSLITDLEI